nr:histone-lysine N-methyltransferase SETD1A-like [Ipomoea batatas]
MTIISSFPWSCCSSKICFAEATAERPKKSRSLDDAAVKVSAEEYEYEIFRSPEEYQKANLEPPRYDLPEKYTPQRAAVTVAVKAPLLETSSREDQGAREQAQDGRGDRAKNLGACGPGRKYPYRPRPARPPHLQGSRDRGSRSGCHLRTPVGDDLMYEFGTWAFNSGRRAMQNDVTTALEVSMDDTDLPKVLAILPGEVPDPGLTPFTSVPEGRNLPVPVVEVSVGPSAEAAATTGPSTELGATLSAGPSAEGDGEPRADPATETS